MWGDLQGGSVCRWPCVKREVGGVSGATAFFTAIAPAHIVARNHLPGCTEQQEKTARRLVTGSVPAGEYVCDVCYTLCLPVTSHPCTAPSSWTSSAAACGCGGAEESQPAEGLRLELIAERSSSSARAVQMRACGRSFDNVIDESIFLQRVCVSVGQACESRLAPAPSSVARRGWAGDAEMGEARELAAGRVTDVDQCCAKSKFSENYD